MLHRFCHLEETLCFEFRNECVLISFNVRRLEWLTFYNFFCFWDWEHSSSIGRLSHIAHTFSVFLFVYYILACSLKALLDHSFANSLKVWSVLKLNRSLTTTSVKVIDSKWKILCFIYGTFAACSISVRCYRLRWEQSTYQCHWKRF